MEQFEENNINGQETDFTEEASASAENIQETATGNADGQTAPDSHRYAPPPYQINPLNYPNGNKETGEPIEGAKNSTAIIVVGFVILTIIIVALAALCISMINRDNSESLQPPAETTGVSAEPGTPAPLPENSVPLVTVPKPDIEEKYMDEDGRYTPQGIAKAVSPSVVGVVVYGEGQTFMPTSQGSGIIISEDGYILTNAHVVDDATAQKIVLNDGTEYEASVIGMDVKTDLAVLKVDGVNGLVPAQLGDSSQLELGEPVMAIGNSGGFSGSITSGIVSGINRKIHTDFSGSSMECIQTDAAINPGNSGGALVNMYGQVVGIVTSKYMNVDIEGIGFAIPINTAVPIIEDLMSFGYVSGRVRIGIIYASISPYTAEINGIVPGMYISEIDPTCDIANTRLQVGDIITEIDGVSTANTENVSKILEGKKAGDTLTAKVYRKSIINGLFDEFTISFKLMEDTSGR